MDALNDNRAERGHAGNLAAMCASLLPATPQERLSSSYQYKNSALSKFQNQNRTNKTSKLKQKQNQ